MKHKLSFLHNFFKACGITTLRCQRDFIKLAAGFCYMMKDAKRIVVIDDDPDHLLVSQLVLERRGYDILPLNNCDDLIDRIRVFRPALIFMDHTMPGMTGIEATRLIKSEADCQDIPVIYFTIRDDIDELAAEAGADDWLIKPFNLDDLVIKTKKFL